MLLRGNVSVECEHYGLASNSFHLITQTETSLKIQACLKVRINDLEIATTMLELGACFFSIKQHF